MRHNWYILILLTLCCLSSCDKRPKGILSKGKMEDVLYDYNIAQGMMADLPYEKRAYAYTYIEAVYKKYGITEAQFDSSLVYYNRHTDDMVDIYKNLKDRFQELNDNLQLTTGNNEMHASFTEGGDTAEIWNGKKLLILKNSQYLNKETFTFKTDSSFHPNDSFRFIANLDFIREDQNNTDISITMCFAIHYKDGKTTSSVNTVSFSGRQELVLDGIDMKEFKSISGYFYYKGDPKSRNFGIVRDIALYRYHTVEGYKAVEVDSVDEDTIKETKEVVPAPKKNTAPRLSPDELRKQNTGTNDANIKTAPDVRTPNSIGPKRRIRRR